eukprot:CAMPEP_0197877334 /NCGR_PEP_ID=MMETSP1439-20131203/6054_1 /TAXON_ID=66791 /ORGANISM="Gonyaulax spinifera, Strain CCMP409" /LENGTH=48 /DNA_ID= /DNA_START= /DNA_END= /DNA_ORIENTATION=
MTTSSAMTTSRAEAPMHCPGGGAKHELWVPTLASVPHFSPLHLAPGAT